MIHIFANIYIYELINILLKAGFKVYSPYLAKKAVYIVNPKIKELFDKCRFIEFKEGDI